MFLVPRPQDPAEKTQLAPLESPKLRQIRGLKRAVIYGLCFVGGVTLAHVVRLTGAWVLYVPALSVGAYFMFLRPADATDSDISLRRVGGLCLVLGAVLAWWDAISLVARSPIVLSWWLFNLVLPFWLVVLGVALLVVFTIVNQE
jgi:hypothetical protein